MFHENFKDTYAAQSGEVRYFDAKTAPWTGCGFVFVIMINNRFDKVRLQIRP